MAEVSEQPSVQQRAQDGGEVKDPNGGYQTDFSVTTRLLPTFSNNASGGVPMPPSAVHTIPLKPLAFPSSPSSSGPPPPLVMPHGWQGYLPPTFPQQWQHQQPTNSSNTEAESLSPPGMYLQQQSWKPLGQDSSALKNEDRGNDEDDSDTESSAHSNSSNGDLEGIEEPKKPKRTRTAYSNSQLDQLELAFSRSHYPDVFTREDLSNKLNIKEDRIQVWFQNRRARYRKQERTGSVSLRSKYRQKRLQRLQQTQAAAMSYYPACGATPTAGGMLASPQPAMAQYMSGFHFPPNYTVGGITPTGSKGAAAAAAQAAPFSASYVAMNLAPNAAVTLSPTTMGSAYSAIPANPLVPPVSQK